MSESTQGRVEEWLAGLALRTFWKSKASFAQGCRSLLVNIGPPLHKDVVHCELSCILGSSDSSTVPNIEHQRFKEPVRSEQQHHIQSVVRFLFGGARLVWAMRQPAERCRNFPSGVSLQSQVVTILIKRLVCVVSERFRWKVHAHDRFWAAACGSKQRACILRTVQRCPFHGVCISCGRAFARGHEEIQGKVLQLLWSVRVVCRVKVDAAGQR